MKSPGRPPDIFLPPRASTPLGRSGAGASNIFLFPTLWGVERPQDRPVLTSQALSQAIFIFRMIFASFPFHPLNLHRFDDRFFELNYLYSMISYIRIKAKLASCQLGPSQDSVVGELGEAAGPDPPVLGLAPTEAKGRLGWAWLGRASVGQPLVGRPDPKDPLRPDRVFAPGQPDALVDHPPEGLQEGHGRLGLAKGRREAPQEVLEGPVEGFF